MRIMINVILILFFILSCNNKKYIDFNNYISFLRGIDSTNYTYNLYIGIDKNFYTFAQKLYIDNILSDTVNVENRLYKYITNTFIVKNVGYNKFEIFSERYKENFNKLYIVLSENSIHLKTDNSEDINISYKINIGDIFNNKLEVISLSNVNFEEYNFKNCLNLRLYENSDNYIDFWLHPKKGLIQYTMTTPDGYSVAFLEKDKLFL